MRSSGSSRSTPPEPHRVGTAVEARSPDEPRRTTRPGACVSGMQFHAGPAIRAGQHGHERIRLESAREPSCACGAAPSRARRSTLGVWGETRRRPFGRLRRSDSHDCVAVGRLRRSQCADCVAAIRPIASRIHADSPDCVANSADCVAAWPTVQSTSRRCRPARRASASTTAPALRSSLTTSSKRRLPITPRADLG